jgi:uncharacterized protein
MSTDSDDSAVDALAEVYYRLIRAFNANDLAAAAAVFHTDVSYTIPGRSPLAGRASGIGEHLAQLRTARELSGGTLHFEPRSVISKGDMLFVYGHITAARENRRLDSDHMVVFRFCEGRILEGRTVPLDLYEFDAFWS